MAQEEKSIRKAAGSRGLAAGALTDVRGGVALSFSLLIGD